MVCEKKLRNRFKTFIERAQGSSDLPDEKLTEQQFRKLSAYRINSVDMEKVKANAVRFIRDDARLDIWSKKYFNDLSAHLKIE